MPNTGTVDERIVEMRIDSQKFEAGAKKTISILEKLDNSLSSLGNKNSDGLDQITNSLDKVTNKFSVMGTIGDQVIRNLTNKTMELISQMTRLGKELTIDQVGAGWSKYADKTSAVQTIMAATAKDFEDQAEQMEVVNEQLDKLNWFTDETSYSFLDMVNNIGKFTSNGIDLKESVTAMEGISTWAAISGANVNEASRAMYNLSQALATGSVKLIDWKSIENANMATREFKETALETAVAIGTLRKVEDGLFETLEGHQFTTEQFNTQLSDGWFSSDVLMKTLNQYGSFSDALNQTVADLEAIGLSYTTTNLLHMMDDWEANKEQWEASHAELRALIPEFEKLSDAQYTLGRRAFKAAQEAKTFREAIDATKDAVSTGWMNLFETMFGGYLEAKGLWTDVAESLWNIFAGPVDTLNDIFSKAFGKGSGADVAQKEVKSLSEKLQEAGYTISDFEKAFSEVDDVRLENIIAQYGSLDEAIRKGAVGAELFRSIIEKMTGSGNGTGESISMAASSVDEKIEELRDVANKVLHGDFKNGEERRQMLEELGYDYEMIQWIAGQIKDSPDVDIKALMGEYEPEMLVKLAEAAGYSEEQISEMNSMLGDTDALLAYLTGEAETTSEALSGLGGRELFTGGLMNLLHLLEDIGEAFSTAFENVFGDTNEQAQKLYNLLQRFYDFTESIQLSESSAQALTDAISLVLHAIQGIGRVASVSFRAVIFVFRTLVGFITQINDALHANDNLQRFADSLRLLFDGIASPIKAVYKYLTSILNIGDTFSKFSFVNSLASLLTAISIRLHSIMYRFNQFMKSAETSRWIKNQLDAIAAVLSKVGNEIKTIYDLFKLGYQKNGLIGAFEAINAHVQVALSKYPALLKFFNSIKAVFASFGSLASSGYSAIRNWFETLDFSKLSKYVPTMEQVRKFFSDILDFASGNFSALSSWFESFKEFKIFDRIGNTVSSVFTVLKNFFAGKSIDLSGLSSKFAKIGKVFDSVIEGLFGDPEIFKNRVTTFFLSIFEGIKAALMQIKLSDVLQTMRLAGLATMLAEITGIFATFRDLEKQVVGIPEAISKMFGNLGDAFKNLGVSFKTNALLKVLVGVGILAASIYALSKLDEERLTHTAVVIGLLFAVIAKIASGLANSDLSGNTNIRIGKEVKKFQVFSELGSVLLGLAAVIFAVSSAIKAFAKASASGLDLGSALLGIAVLIGTLGLIIKFASSIPKSSNMTGVMGVLIATAVAIRLLVSPILKLAEINNPQALTDAMGIIYQLAAILAVMTFLMSFLDHAKLGNSSKGLLKASAAMAVMAIAINLLVKPLMALTSSGLIGKEMGKAAGIMAALAIGLTAIATVLSFLNPKGLLAGAAALILIALAMNIAVPALMTMAGAIIAFTTVVQWEKMTDRIAAFKTALGSLALLGSVLLIFAAAILVAGAGIGLFGIGVLAAGGGSILLAIGISLLAGAVERLGAAIPVLVTGIADAGNIMRDRHDDMIEGGKAFALIAAGVLVTTVALAGLIYIFSKFNLGEKFAAFASGVGGGIATIFTNIGGAIKNNLPLILQLATAAFIVIALHIIDLIPTIVELLVSGIITLIQSVADSLRNNSGPLLHAVTDVISMIAETAVKAALWAVGAVLSLVSDALLGGFREILDGIIATVENNPLLERVLGKDAVANLKGFRDSLYSFGDDIQAYFEQAGDDVAEAIRKRVVYPTEESVRDAKDIIADVGNVDYSKNVEVAFNAVGLDDSALAKIPQQLAGSLQNGSDEVQDAGTDLANAGMLGYVTQWSDGIPNVSTQVGDMIFGDNGMIGQVFNGSIAGIEAGEGDLANAVSSTASAAVSDGTASSNAISIANTHGRNIDAGIAQGIYDNAGVVQTASECVAGIANRAFARSKYMQIASPAKAFIKLASYIPAGIAEGIEQNTDVATDSMVILGSSVLAAMQMAMAHVATVADDSFEFNPVITPVVDMTNLTSAANTANASFGSITSAMRGSIRVSADNAQYAAANIHPEDGNAAVVSEIQLLSSRLDKLGDAVTNMQIVMDTGALVGATSKQMDGAFGTMQARRGRGN